MAARYGLKDTVDTQLRYSLLIQMRLPLEKTLYMRGPLWSIARVFWRNIQDPLDQLYEPQTTERGARDELERSPFEADIP